MPLLSPVNGSCEASFAFVCCSSTCAKHTIGLNYVHLIQGFQHAPNTCLISFFFSFSACDKAIIHYKISISRDVFRKKSREASICLGKLTREQLQHV